MTTRKTTRRAILAGAAALPALSVPSLATTSAVDPIYAAIDKHQKLSAAWHQIYSALDTAEGEAAAIHGHRPIALIAWRNYSHIGGSEIEARREEFLRQPGADRKQIEREYHDAKAREAVIEQAGIEWDKRTGLAALREQSERAADAYAADDAAMAKTKPQTPGGAGALLAYVLEDMEDGEADWHMVAICTAAAALQEMAVQS